MKNKMFFSTLLTIVLLGMKAFAGPSGEDIVKKADRSRFPDGDVSFHVEVKDFQGKELIASSLYKVRARGNESSLVETIEPVRQQGQKILMLTDNLWFMSPNIKRPTRISIQQRLTGQVANGDIAKANFAGDYSAQVIGEEDLNGKKTIKLSLKANRKEVTYSAIDYWVDAKIFIPVKAHFFATSGKLLKIGTYGDFRPESGVLRPYSMEIEDAVTRQKKSVLKYRNIKKEKFSDSIFNKESL